MRALLADDSGIDLDRLTDVLRRGGYDAHCSRVATAGAIEAALWQADWDLVLARWTSSHFANQPALQAYFKLELDLPLIALTDEADEAAAAAAMQHGADDCIPLTALDRLVPAIQRELRNAQVRRERRLRQQEYAFRVAANATSPETHTETAEEEQAELSHRLARFGADVIAALDTPVLLDRLCELVTDVLECDFSTTLQWRADEAVYVPIANHGDTLEQWEVMRLLRLPSDLFANLRARFEREDVVQIALAESPHPVVRELGTELRIGAVLYMPLRRGGHTIGLQVAGYRDPDATFPRVRERIGRGIVHYASMALEHSRIVEELACANRLASDFVATMTHELRTPLNIIIGYERLLEDQAFGPLIPEQADALRHVGKSADDLLGLIDGILTMNQLDNGTVSIDRSPIDVPDLIQQVLGEILRLGIKPELAIDVSVLGDLPCVESDRVKIKVVLKNVVGNAVKFTDRGRIAIEVRSARGGIAIDVADTGVGISPEALPSIFEPFRQGESAMHRKRGGVGLGLSTARGLLDLLGGTIGVQSEIGSGSTFKIWLPRR